MVDTRYATHCKHSMTSDLLLVGESPADGLGCSCAVEGRGISQPTVCPTARPRSAVLLHLHTATPGHKLRRPDE